MNPNEKRVRDFCDAFHRFDPDELIGYIAPDCFYHNVPVPPAHGRDNILKVLRGMAKRIKSMHADIRNVVASGDVVMVERVDHMRYTDREVSLPIVGVFELENGQIKAWREYFDMGMFLKRGAS